MSQIIQNESHLKKWVTLVETGHVSKKQLDFLKLIKWVGNESNYQKCVTFEEMGHSFRNTPGLKKSSWTY